MSAALIGSARAHDVQVPGSFDDLAFAEATDGIFFVHEMQVLPDAENHGFMSNSGAVFTEGWRLSIPEEVLMWPRHSR